MNSSLSQYYLKMMGIPLWRERQALAGAKQVINYQIFTLNNRQRQGVGALWLEMSPMEPAQEAKMLQLLDAMLAAIHLDRNPPYFLNPPCPPFPKGNYSLPPLLEKGGRGDLRDRGDFCSKGDSHPQWQMIMGLNLAQQILESTEELDSLRAQNWHTINNLPTLITYHPLVLLAEPIHKRKAWEDLQCLSLKARSSQ